MARLTVPNAFKPALIKLASLSEESATEVLSAIESSQPVLDPRKMATKIAPSVRSIPHDDLRGILIATFSLSAVRILNKVSISGFLDDVCDSLHAKKSEFNAPVLRSRLERLLQMPPIVLASKASAIQREHASVLVDTRILTDIRPVFGEGPESFQGAIIVHNLKITSLQANVVKENFFALDDDDLTMLQKTLARAEAKSKSLRAFIEKSGLPNMEPTTE